jgi:hypothetical protein
MRDSHKIINNSESEAEHGFTLRVFKEKELCQSGKYHTRWLILETW